jgi:hypothetical protein
VLEFTVNMESPGYVRLSFVFGSDEYDAWWDPQDTQGFNDAIAVLIDSRNIATFRHNDAGAITDEPFKLNDLIMCGEKFFKENQIAPNPAALHDSDHEIAGLGEVYYNHEYGGFSKVLTRESRALAPGNHTIKIVVQDMYDTNVDSAIFVQRESLKLYPLAQGDYNDDGSVNSADYVVWRNSVDNPPADPSFRDGDGNGDGVVNSADWQLWNSNYGNTGNRDWKADFNRSGCVSLTDVGIFNTFMGTLGCASRFEGDATGDGKVTLADLPTLLAEMEQSQGCGGGQAMMAGGGEDGGEGNDELQQVYQKLVAEHGAGFLDKLKQSVQDVIAAAEVALAPLAKEALPPDPDMDDDGDLDADDLAELDAIILGG